MSDGVKALNLLSMLLVFFGGLDMSYLHLWTVLTNCHTRETERYIMTSCTEIRASGIVRHFAAAL
jgi:hypothetical protein